MSVEIVGELVLLFDFHNEKKNDDIIYERYERRVLAAHPFASRCTTTW